MLNMFDGTNNTIFRERKSMKKLAIVLIVAFAAIACVFAQGAQESAVKTYKVGVSIYQYTDNFMTLYRNEIQSYFKSLETDKVKYSLTMYDGKNDMAEQSNQVDTMIAQGTDVIILNLVQTSSAEALIDKIAAANIPCILINREPAADTFAKYDKVCYVGADAKQSGTMQGNIVLALANKGDVNGDGKVSYIMIEGDPENSDAQYRTQFSVKALTDAGVKVECLDDQVGNWDQTKG